MRKEILEAPVLPPVREWPKNGDLKEIRWQVAGEWAIGDCYKDRRYLGRYVIDQKGRHGMLRGRKRDPVTLLWMFEKITDKWMWPDGVQCDKAELEEVRVFLDPEGRYRWKKSGMGVVVSLEQDYNGDTRLNAARRKQQRIDDMMNDVPALPDNLDNWLFEKVWPADYLFPSDAEYDTEDRHGCAFYCTACGKLHRYKEIPKLGAVLICEKTGRTVERRRKGSKIDDSEKVMVLQKIDDFRSVARHLIVRRLLADGCSEYAVFEEIRIILYHRVCDVLDEMRTMLHGKGIRQGRTGIKDKVYYGQLRCADEFEQEWSDHNPWMKRIGSRLCYPEGVREALAGTLYEKTPVAKMAAKGWRLNYNEVMLSVNQAALPPILEFMTGMNLRRLVCYLTDHLSWGHLYAAFLNTAGNSAQEVLGINAQRIRRLCSMNGGRTMLMWLKREEKTGKKIKDEVLEWMEGKNLSPEDLGFILDRMSPEQVKNYITRECRMYSIRNFIITWSDYLSMAKRLGLDVDDEIIYRAKNLVARHDEVVEEFARRKDAIEAAEFERKYGKITKACARIRDKFDYTGEEFCVITPKGAQDIIEDSRQLHHCAGSSDRYYERIEQDETYILFLRRKNEPDKAYYTLEVEPDGTTRQKRSAYNRQPDLQEINTFLREWQAVVKKRLKEADREAARVSAAKRAEEMAVLAASDRQRDIDLFKALEADLLAAAT